MVSQSKLHAWLSAHLAVSFILLTASFLAFGMLSLDLTRVVMANAEYISHNGWEGLADGGLQQMFELGIEAIAAMLFYLLFKLCEHVLTHRLVQARS